MSGINIFAIACKRVFGNDKFGVGNKARGEIWLPSSVEISSGRAVFFACLFNIFLVASKLASWNY
jgi:hypothetical protein